MTIRSQGLGAPKRSVLEQLRQHGTMTVDALVKAVGLSKTATRAHLVHLQRDGTVIRATPAPQGPGRPPVRFCLTEYGASMFPSADSPLLAGLLVFLEKNDRGELVAEFFKELWAEKRTDLLDSLGIDSPEVANLDERLVALKACLRNKGLMPTIERSTTSDGSIVVTVREHNCPFHTAARVSRLPCESEVNFLADVLTVPPRAVSFATCRKDICSFDFVIPALDAKT